MRRIFIFIFITLTVCLTYANPIDKQQARQLATQFMQSRGAQLKGEPMRVPGRKASTKQQPIYVFNTEEEQGFVIVAGDDRATSILGYTTKGCYDEEAIPENFRSWLQSIADEIETLNKTDGKMQNASAIIARHEAISPLIKTEWDQGGATEEGFIYNMLCPTINNKHCITGCVATAFAQLMYYYQWPQEATKTVPGYINGSSVADTSKDLPPISFKWGDMKWKYTYDDMGTASAIAVSELMLYCGYAAQMGYGLNNSAGWTHLSAQGLVDYFDYSPIYSNINRNEFSISEWDELIYRELKEGRPIIYGGYGNYNGIGHTFICDGYDGCGLYHFNWGMGWKIRWLFCIACYKPLLHEQQY